MANKFIDQNGLRYFFSKLKRMFEKKADKDSLKPVATSGKYSDLEDKPVIDAAVTEGSSNAVSGGAVYEAIQNSGGNNGDVIVTVTESNNDFTADKTFAELVAAVNAGKSIVAKYSDIVIPYVGASTSFSSTTEGGTSTPTITSLYFQAELGTEVYNFVCDASGWQRDDLRLMHEQVDQEQNDSTQMNYIKNRTHWKETKFVPETIIFPETEVDLSANDGNGYSQSTPLNVNVGDEIKVLFDNTLYECTVKSMDMEGMEVIYFGNAYGTELDKSDLDSNKYPFLGLANYTFSENGDGMVSGATFMTGGEEYAEYAKVVKIKVFTGGNETVYHPIDKNYLPQAKTISNEDNLVVMTKPLISFLKKNASDCDVDDEADIRYIKNRPCSRYLSNNSTDFGKQTIALDSNGVNDSNNLFLGLKNKAEEASEDVNLNITWNGTSYTRFLRYAYCTWTNTEGSGTGQGVWAFGNVSAISEEWSDTAPFLVCIDWNPETHQNGHDYVKVYDGSTGNITVELTASYKVWNYNPLSSKYLNLSTRVSESDENPVTSKAVYDYIENHTSEVDVDTSVVEGSSNAVSGGAVYTALQNVKVNTVSSISDASTDSEVPSAKAVYEAIQAAFYVNGSDVAT